MTRRYDYKIFPETWKARLLLAAAFLAFPVILVTSVLAFPAIPASEPVSPCAPASYPDCLRAQNALTDGAKESCDGRGRRVCLVPLGKVSPALVRHLVDHYREEYGLTISVLTPTAIPESLMNEERDQVDALDLGELMRTTRSTRATLTSL